MTQKNAVRTQYGTAYIAVLQAGSLVLDVYRKVIEIFRTLRSDEIKILQVGSYSYCTMVQIKNCHQHVKYGTS